ncbi:MAG: hypothetical protein DWQ01_00935 [Planctomycetota bacterium]|nr:MAG: hypothetical protein DWQ01_00935 [Planctomycetota bacterium]
MQSTLLGNPEDRLYRAYWQDGSLDLFAGIAALIVGVAWILDLVWLGPIAPALTVPMWMSFRSSVIEPRLGKIRFQNQRRLRLRRAHWIMVIVGLLVLAFGVFRYLHTHSDSGSELLQDWIAALPGALLGIMAIQAALLFQLPRFLLYGGVFLASGLLFSFWKLEPGWSIAAGGFITMVCGMGLLARFFRNFPQLPSELE